jgi:hypothetical protein
VGEQLIDDLARALVQPMPRRRAVRLLGATLAAAAVSGLRPGRLLAQRTRTCDAGCGEDVRACPHLVQGVPVWDFCCGSPAKRYACGGDYYTPKCIDTCGGSNDIPCPSTEIDVDGCPKFLCCKRPESIGCEDGDCIPNCHWPPTPANLASTQCGTKCCPKGGYCCDRIFSSKDPYCCDYEEALKVPAKDIEVASMIAACALGAALVFITGGTAAFFIVGGMATGAGIAGIAGKWIGDDPPDPRYKELVHPRVPRVVPVPRGKGISPAAARALDRLIANRLRFGAYAVAYIRSIEKAQGADKARDKTWARRHRKAAAGYAREAATTLGRDRSLSTVALRELKRGGFVDTGVSLAQARQWQQRVRQRGLPADTTRVLRAAGVDDKRIAAFRTAVSRLDPKLVAGVGVFGNLTDRRLADANAAMIKALRRSARKLTAAR